MIDAAIGYLAGELNQHLQRVLDSDEDVVVVSNVLEQDGTVATHVSNRIAAFLVNVEKDAATRQPPNGESLAPAGRVVTYPPVYLNLYVMFAAHFAGTNYPEALKLLSSTVAYFQSRPVFDHAIAPDLDDRIDRLVLDIENLSIHDLSNLWGVLSGHYLPSVLYKVRMVAFDRGGVRGRAPVATTPRPSVGGG